MLFLAVSLGFFVDNFREERSERAQERVLMRQVVEDLREDQLAADSNVAIRHWRRGKLDSLLTLHRDGTAALYAADLYYFAQLVRNRYMFVPHTGAFEQLDGGGLRLVTNPRVMRAIQRYRAQVDDLRQMQFLDDDQVQRYRNGPLLRLLNPTVVRDITHQEEESLERRVERPRGAVRLMTTDPGTLNEFFMLAQSLLAFNTTVTRLVQHVHRSAGELAALIEVEYGLAGGSPGRRQVGR